MAGPPSKAIYHSKSNISVSGSFSFQILCLKKCQNASPHHKYWDVSPQPSTRWAWRGGSASQWNQQPRQPPPREHGSRCVPVIPIKLHLELRLQILLCSNFFVGMDVPRDLSGDGSDVRNEILELAQHLRQESLYIKNEKSQVRQKFIFCLYALFQGFSSVLFRLFLSWG